jgi:hypothetical protein
VFSFIYIHFGYFGHQRFRAGGAFCFVFCKFEHYFGYGVIALSRLCQNLFPETTSMIGAIIGSQFFTFRLASCAVSFVVSFSRKAYAKGRFAEFATSAKMYRFF